jgi:hypothetical protein
LLRSFHASRLLRSALAGRRPVATAVRQRLVPLAAPPASHYDGDMRARGNLRAWREGRQLNLAIRRRPGGEAVGWVELRRAAEKCEFVFAGQDGEECKFERHLTGRGS